MHTSGGDWPHNEQSCHLAIKSQSIHTDKPLAFSFLQYLVNINILVEPALCLTGPNFKISHLFSCTVIGVPNAKNLVVSGHAHPAGFFASFCWLFFKNNQQNRMSLVSFNNSTKYNLIVLIWSLVLGVAWWIWPQAEDCFKSWCGKSGLWCTYLHFGVARTDNRARYWCGTGKLSMAGLPHLMIPHFPPMVMACVCFTNVLYSVDAQA